MRAWLVRAGLATVVVVGLVMASVQVVSTRLGAAVADSVQQAVEAVPLPPGAGTFSHPEFSLLDRLTLVGAARRQGDDLVLTRSRRSAGGVWADGELAPQRSWSTSFGLTVRRRGPRVGDGVAFVLQAVAARPGPAPLGGIGGGLGYRGLGQSVAVELDTFSNEWDPAYEHVALDVDGWVDIPVAIEPLPFELLGSTVRVRINYDAEASWLYVYVTPEGEFEGGPLLSAPLDLAGEVGGGQVRAGLVAATGKGDEVVAVHDWTLRAIPPAGPVAAG